MNPQPERARLWWTGFCAGIRALTASKTPGDLRRAMRFLLCPVDFWRYLEVAAVLSGAGPNTALSIGSPTVAPLAVASRGAKVFALDFARAAVIEAGICGEGLLHPAQADALHLPFSDNSFPFVFSVSAFEHIGGEGDSFAVREAVRVLSPGGTLVLTLPVSPEYHERWIDSDPYGMQMTDKSGKVFFSRYYDAASLQSRIIAPAGIPLCATQVWQERSEGWYAAYCARTERAMSPLAIATKLLDPLWASTRLEQVQGGVASLRRHGLVALVFRKPA